MNRNLIVVAIIVGLVQSSQARYIAQNAPTECDAIEAGNLDQLEVIAEFDYEDLFQIAWFPESTQLAVAAGRAGVHIHKLQDVSYPTTVSTDPATFVTFSPNGEYLAFGHEDIHLLNVETEAINVFEPDNSDTSRTTSAAFSPDSTQLATLQFETGAIRLWNVETRVQIATAEIAEGTSRIGQEIIFNSDRSKLFSAIGRYIIVWNAQTLTELLNSELTNAVLDIDLRSDEAILAALSSDFSLDTKVALLDAESLVEIAVIPSFIGSYSLAFNPDGTLLAVGDYDGIHVWEIGSNIETPSLSEAYYLDGDNSELRVVVFSPDGKFLVSATQNNGRIIIWGACS